MIHFQIAKQYDILYICKIVKILLCTKNQIQKYIHEQ